jgi:hypothetical protein
MPKIGKDWDTTLNFGSTLAMKQYLVAMGYFSGMGGEYASPARNLIEQHYREWLAALSGTERKRFDEILGNVKLMITK